MLTKKLDSVVNVIYFYFYIIIFNFLIYIILLLIRKHLHIIIIIINHCLSIDATYKRTRKKTLNFAIVDATHNNCTVFIPDPMRVGDLRRFPRVEKFLRSFPRSHYSLTYAT